MPKIQIEYSDTGRFRLVVDESRSEWELYEHPCIHAGYLALSGYYGDKEQVFQIVEIPNTDVPIVQVCPECGKPTGWNGEVLPKTACEHQLAKWPTLVEGYVAP